MNFVLSRTSVMRRGGLACSLVLFTGVLAATAEPTAPQPLDAEAVRARSAAPKTPFAGFAAGRPSGPNPYLSFLPAGAKPDYAAWRNWLAQEGKARRTVQPPADPSKLIGAGESEPNDTRATADAVPGFGTGTGDDPAADLTGTIDPPPAPTIIGPFAEDNGSIPLAVATGLASGFTVRTSGSIGDGPYGSGGTGSGDFDFFRLDGVAAGDEILIDADTPIPFCCGDLDPFVTIFDAAGNLLAYNDDQPTGGTYDSYLLYTAPAPGVYYVVIGAYTSPFPTNRFDSSTGTGFASQGTYDVTIGLNATDADHFSFDLEPGDVISGNLLASSGTRVTLFDPSGVERIGSTQNLNAILPGPYPQGGAAGFTYVVETPGTYVVRVGSVPGAYTLELRDFRPYLEQGLRGVAQVVFVDFDGAVVDTSLFGSSGNANLSPLSSFLAGWGLTPADEGAVIDAILATLVENLSTDMRVLALNGDYDVTNLPGDFDVVILNSRDHADPLGNPNVSRLVVGGTIDELGFATIGIASAIDPGNYSTSDVAVVLLDLLSGVPADPNSLNQFALHPGASKIDLVGRGVGNVAAHEAGHFFSSFHTDQLDAQANVMDQGGNLPNSTGVGPDLIFGNGDDVDVDFGVDAFVPNEGFTGFEDTLNATAFGLSTGMFECPVLPLGGCRVAGKSTLQIKDKTSDKQDALSFAWLNGSATSFAELGAPLASSDYRVCVYDAGGLVRSATAPAGGLCRGKPCWKQTGPTSAPNGFVYRDPDLTPDGTATVVLKSGLAGKAKVQWKAKGQPLDDGALGVVPPVVVEVSHGDGSVCFGQTFGALDIVTNNTIELKAKVP